MALPIGPFPFTLTNGTLADANQVMANFNTLLNGINGLAPLSSAISGGTSNVAATLASAGTTITVTADSVTVATALNGSSYTLTTYSQSFNGATTGAGGMDTGSLPTSGFVALYAIYNPTAPTISILGKNAAASAPTIYNGANMPAGYTASALLCVLPTNATPALKPVTVRGKNHSVPVVNILNSTTNQTSPTSLSAATAVPVNAVTTSGYVQLNPSSNAAGNFGVTMFADSAGNGSQVFVGVQNATAVVVVGAPFNQLNISTSQTVFYQTTNVSASMAALIFISGYAIP